MWILICSGFIRTTNVYREKTGIGNSCNNEWSPLGSFYFFPTFSIFDQHLWMERGNAYNRSICSTWMCIWTHVGTCEEPGPKQIISRCTKAEYGLHHDLQYGKNESFPDYQCWYKIHETMLTKLKTIFDPSVLKSLSIVFLHWMLFCLGYLVVYTA